MSGLSTVPATVEMASPETQSIVVDFAHYLDAATIASATVTLTNRSTGLAYAAGLGAKSNTNTTVTQVLTALVAGETYRLVVTITDSTGRVQSCETSIVTVF